MTWAVGFVFGMGLVVTLGMFVSPDVVGLGVLVLSGVVTLASIRH